MTLWELAKMMRTAGDASDIEPAADLMGKCCAEILEQWAREKAKEWRYDPISCDPRELEICKDVYGLCADDLGVPDDEIRREK